MGDYLGRAKRAGLVDLAERLSGRGVRYLVIDAGCIPKKAGMPWDNCAGDWEVSNTLFPEGLKATANALQAIGLVPGIWFEFKVSLPGCRWLR